MSDLGNKEIFAKNLKYYMNLYKKDRYDVCKDLNFKYSTFSDWCNGKKYPRIDKIEILANYFHIEKSDLIENKNKYSTPNSISLNELFKDKVPLLGTVKAGYDYLANENIIDYIAINFKKEDYDYYALKIIGDSMETIMSDGDFVIIQKQNDFNSGDYCVVLINGEEATVKRVFKSDDGIELVALNPSYKSRKFSFEDMKKVPVEVIGIVKQLIKNLN